MAYKHISAKTRQVEWLEDDPIPDTPPPPVPPENVKAEAYRRIVAICPEWKQRNLTAQAVLLVEKGRSNWTAEEQAAWDAGEAIWSQIAAIRAASDVLEALDPIPTDYMDDKHWV